MNPDFVQESVTVQIEKSQYLQKNCKCVENKNYSKMTCTR